MSISKYSRRQCGVAISSLEWANVGGSQIVWMILKRKSAPSDGYGCLSRFFNRGTKRLEFFVYVLHLISIVALIPLTLRVQRTVLIYPLPDSYPVKVVIPRV